MENFDFYVPTEIVFGKETELRVGELVKKYGGEKVLVHFGGSSAKKSGLLDRVYSALDNSGVKYVSLGGVVPNPRLSLVYEGIKLCRAENVNFILAVGGGSVIDSAKAIGYGIANDFDVWELYSGKRSTDKCAPIGSVLTIAAAGSEMSNSSVITNENGWLKRGHTNQCSRPKFAVMNPELTCTLPQYQTACGCTDIVMHTLERYFHNNEPMELTDGIAEALIRNTVKYSAVLMNDPQNYKARAEIMWAGSLSHNDLTGARGKGDWASHQLEHELSGMFDIAHGAGLAAIWGSWARYVYKVNPSRFAQLGKAVFGINAADDEQGALECIKAMENFFRSIKMPLSVHEIGIELTDAQIEELADKCSNGDTITKGGFKILHKADMIEIYKMAR